MSWPDPAAHGADDPSASPDPEPVGSVVQEAFKLLRAVTPSPRDGDPHSAAGHVDDHACTTAWCPVCQVVGLVRDNPDAIASVTRSACDLARSLRDLVDAALAPEEKKQ